MPKPGNIPESFVDALESLANWLQNSHIPYSIIGGVAVSFIANPRTTQDIDSVIWLDIANLDDFLASGSDYGFVSRLSDAAEFARQSRVLLLRHSPSSVDIDISLAATPFEQELLDRALTISLGKFSVNIPTPEDLIIMKAIAARNIDYIDINNIMEIVPDLDLNRIRDWVKQYADLLEMPELYEKLDRILTSDK